MRIDSCFKGKNKYPTFSVETDHFLFVVVVVVVVDVAA